MIPLSITRRKLLMRIIEPAPMVETSASSTFVKMNYIAFVALPLMSVQAAMAIHCYQCQPSQDEVLNYVNRKLMGNTSEPPCSNPTEVFDCSQDPNTGMMADSCLTASITLNYPIAGDLNFTFNVLNCSVKSFCNTTKNFTCTTMGLVFQSISVINMVQCDVSCCEGDRCNGPSAVNSTPSTSSEGSSANTGPTTSPGPTASALQSTKAPFNAAIFSIVSLVYLAITNLF